MITSVTFDDISPTYLALSELKKLINFLDEMDIPCTLFVVPNEHKSHFSKEFTSCLRTVLDRGHELALHGYRHTKNEFGYFLPLPFVPFPAFKKQKQRLERGVENLINLTGVKPSGFRAPFYLYNNITLRALSSLGFLYDSSATIFKPTHGMRLRVKWLRGCGPFVTQGMTEIPVTGDYTYSLSGHDYFDFLRKAMRDFEWIKSRHGVFVLNNHPQRFGDVGYRFLRFLIEKLSKKTNFLRLCDIAEM